MLRGWGLLCKFMYFPTNAVVAEYFSLAWSIKQAQGYNWGQLGLFLQTLFSGGSPRPLLANDQHWEMLRQTEENCITKTCWDCRGMTSNGRKSKYNICAKKFRLWNHRWWFMWWCSSPVYIITNLIWFDKYPKYHIYKSSINMISIRTIIIISGIMIYSAVNHSYDSKRTIKIISGIINNDLFKQ